MSPSDIGRIINAVETDIVDLKRQIREYSNPPVEMLQRLERLKQEALEWRAQADENDKSRNA